MSYPHPHPYSWEVRGVDDLTSQGVVLHAYRNNASERTEYLTNESRLVFGTCEPGFSTPDAGLWLPGDFWRGLVKSIAPAPSTDGEIRRLEEALAVERGRVDQLLSVVNGR